MAVGAVFTIILGLAGIGLLMFRSWGRTLSIVYVIYAFISMIVGIVINFCFLLPPLLEKQAALPPGPEKAGAMGGIVGILAGSCIGFIYPIILLIFMYRPNVKAALQKQKPADQVRF